MNNTKLKSPSARISPIDIQITQMGKKMRR